MSLQKTMAQTNSLGMSYSVTTIFWVLMAIASLYVVYMCEGEVSLFQIILSMLCGPCYLIYALWLLFDKENKGCGLLK
jgi:hypothetical protein